MKPTPRSHEDRAAILVGNLQTGAAALATFGVSREAAAMIVAAIFGSLTGMRRTTLDRMWEGAGRRVTLPPAAVSRRQESG